eukprot:XP_017952886.1 PREDICTED: oocyte zinc finger protein XlCOF7.1-like [Xenopus tropicalis]
MGMWEEASDPVMGKKDKNEERKERILNLTLEIIYLLTGEGYVIPKKKSPTVGLGALHAPGSVIQKENDKKILELISNIIQLLTGEVAIRSEDVSIYFSLEEWEYIKGNKALYREGIKEEEEPQQLRPLDGEYEDKREIPADLGGTLCYNNEPSKIGAEGADFCADGNLTNSEISPVEQPPPANGIKEEVGNQSDCSINPLTEQIQGTNTPTPIMGCSLNNSSADNYISTDADEEEASWEEGNLSDFRIITVPGSVQETNTPHPIMGCSLAQYWSVGGSGSKSQAVHGMESIHVGRHERSRKREKPFFCPQCGDCFTTGSQLKSHLKTHNGKKTFCCSECGKCFSRRSELNRHLRIHARTKPFCCPECGKCFKRHSDFYSHQITHTGEEPFQCPQCGKGFTRGAYLNAHLRMHARKKLYSCSECGKCFTDHTPFIMHQRTHTGEKPFVCSECGKGFAQRSNLTSHQKIHSGEKPFSCSACGKSFKRRTNLRVHQRIHTGEKIFSCPECAKCFTDRSNLNVHLRTHTGERPFSCSECGKCFAQRGDLKIHRRRMHQ